MLTVISRMCLNYTVVYFGLCKSRQRNMAEDVDILGQ